MVWRGSASMVAREFWWSGGQRRGPIVGGGDGGRGEVDGGGR
jgi:hypothetical protein